MKPSIQLARRQRGYTLLEAGFAVVIATLLAAAGVTVVTKRADTFRVDRAQQDMKQVLEAGMQYRRDTGAWPANATALTTPTAYLQGASLTGPFGGSYSVSTVSGRLRVAYDATQVRFANLISTALPLSSVSGTTVYGEVTVPGSEISHDGLLPRDGSRPMTGTLNMNGNHIVNTGNVTGSGAYVTSSYMQADVFYDYYNSGYYMQPRARTRLNEMYADYTLGYNWMQAPIFYDLNDSGNYYIDPNGTSYMNVSVMRSYMYSPMYYDWNDGNFYLDPNGSSRLNTIEGNAVNSYSFYDRTKGVYNDQAVHQVYLVGNNDIVNKPICYGGHTARIYTAISSASDNGIASPVGGLQSYTTDNGSSWTIKFNLYVVGQASPSTPSSTYAKVVAITKCE